MNERLGRIKEIRNREKNGEKISVNNSGIDWLIEQAERAEELEKENDDLTGFYNSKNSDYLKEKGMRDHSEQQNKRYRDARKRIELMWVKEYKRNANEYEGGRLDGFDIAMIIIDEALEED